MSAATQTLVGSPSTMSRRVSLAIVVTSVLGLWLAPTTPAFLVAWAALFAWGAVRVAGRPST
ncbi:MAG: hypothetical protein ACOZQL_09715, partial [Myxococcota bacterium]